MGSEKCGEHDQVELYTGDVYCTCNTIIKNKTYCFD